MQRKYDAPWVVLGMPDKNKMLVSYRAKLGGHETAICERVKTENGDKPGAVYMRLMWCNKEAVATFRDHLNEMLEIWDELTDREDATMAERVVNRFMITKGLKAYLSGDYDNSDNPYWDAENETFNGGQLAIDAIQMLETDYKLLNELMTLLEKETGVEIGGKSAVDA